ncbi:VrrA/YqfQ family protein [Caldibacillus thermoamylovorans]
MTAMRYGRPPMMPSPFAGGPPFPFTRMPAAPLRPNGPGNLLTRLFSRAQTPTVSSSLWGLPTLPGAAPTAAATNTGGGLIGMLNNVQKMLGIAQNVMPMVQQYGPLIRNLPAMIRIFRELKPADEDESEAKTENATKDNAPKPAAAKQKKRPVPKAADDEPQKRPPSTAPRPSTPKLYI